MKNLPALILTVFVLALAGCEQPSSIPEATLGAWEKAFNAGDAAAIAAVYTEDATLMPPGLPTMKGRAAIEQYMREGFAQGVAKVALTTDEMFTMGDAAVRRGAYRVSAADGNEIEAGKYVEIWRRVGNEWQICIDIWNADTAPPPPAPPEPPAAPAPQSPG
jgi:uncharacterized protein (TIGR02246 family)